MSLPINANTTSLTKSRNSRWLLYGLFVILSVVLFALAVLRVEPLMALVPASLLAVAYARSVKWTGLLKAYLAVLFLVPIGPYTLVGNFLVDIEPNRVFAALLLFLWFSLLLIDPSLKLKRTGLEAPLFALFASLVLSIGINLDSYSHFELTVAIKSILLLVSYIFVLYLIVSVSSEYSEVTSMLRWLVLISMIMSFFGIVERFTDYNVFKSLHEFFPFLNADMDKVTSRIYRGGLRIAGPVDHPIGFAALLVMFLPVTFYFFHTSKTVARKIWYGMGLAANLAAMLLTVSATALVGIAAVVATLFFTNPRRGLGLFLVVALFAVCASVVLYSDYAFLMERISYNYLAENEVGNNYGRLADYPRVWQEFLERPLFGKGFGTFDEQKYYYLDNQYLGFIVEIGIVGTLCLVWLFYSLVRKLRGLAAKSTGSMADLASTLSAIVMAFAMMSLAFDTFGFAQVAYALFILGGFGIALVTISEGNSQKATAITGIDESS